MAVLSIDAVSILYYMDTNINKDAIRENKIESVQRQNNEIVY